MTDHTSQNVHVTFSQTKCARKLSRFTRQKPPMRAYSLPFSALHFLYLDASRRPGATMYPRVHRVIVIVHVNACHDKSKRVQRGHAQREMPARLAFVPRPYVDFAPRYVCPMFEPFQVFKSDAHGPRRRHALSHIVAQRSRLRSPTPRSRRENNEVRNIVAGPTVPA